MRRVKIVCALGSATDSYEQVRALVEAGMDVARLGLGHGGKRGADDERYRWVRKAADETGRSVCLLADLRGRKTRLGRFRAGPVLLGAGDEFTLTGEEGVLGDRHGCGTTCVGLAGAVGPGQRVLVDEGRVVLEVVSVDGSRVRTRVVEGGGVADHAGLNLPGVLTSAPALGAADEDDLRWALRTGFDVVALSFVRSGRDVAAVHRVMDEEGRRLPVLAKVEKPQAVEAIEEIVAAFDGIVVARGDLGAEMPLERVPSVQKRVVELARRAAKPVVVSTQLLDSMTGRVRPTRAEASDVANAVLDGTDAVMLSGETSAGAHPVEAVATMVRIVEAAEEDFLGAGLAPLTDGDRPRSRGGAVARAAAGIGDCLGARYLVAFTQSGDTARRLARHRSPIPVLAFTAEQATRSRLSLTWGVETFLEPAAGSTDAMITQVEEALLRYGRCRRGDVVVLTAGSPPGVRGTTNMVRVHRVGGGGAGSG
ncbi:pyruvate kinase [Streptomyces griseoaurantiacus]|uniref:pyruvate kinase n=1 Tax=Streptomyces griseoaurantiacus TaxID=68213 RepID=UPI00352C07C7